MKQPEDNKTVDMYGDEGVQLLDTPKSKKYAFYMDLRDGTTLVWHGLSELTAKTMYRATDKSLRDTHNTVQRYGWEEVK